MKYFLLLCLAGLSGCTGFMPRPYDPVEYNNLISLTVVSTQAIHNCPIRGDDFVASMNKLKAASEHLDEFISNKRDIGNVEVSVKHLNFMIMTIINNPNYSNQYCTHKLSNIQASSRILSRAIGDDKDLNLCQGNVQTRYALFEDSYLKKRITKPEFKDLTSDLRRLKEIDASACKMELMIQMQEAIQAIESSMAVLGVL
jgi:hypothetical protein